MFIRDNQGTGMPSEAAQAGLCAVLALFFALGGDRLVGIERGFYDLCQRLSAAAADAPVVIVQPDADAADLWSLPRLDELIGSVRAAGAKAIIPATPAPPLATTDDVGRLQSLLRLEERGGAPAGSAEPGLLRRQLAEAEERLARQDGRQRGPRPGDYRVPPRTFVCRQPVQPAGRRGQRPFRLP
jgi:hypothetical protein